MTDKSLEPAARRLCAIRGYDPDAPSGVMSFNTPNWKAVIPEIRSHLEREQALRETMPQPTLSFDPKTGTITTSWPIVLPRPFNIEDTRK